MSVVRFAFINIIVVLILLVVVNWVCGIYLRKTADPPRSSLPNYDNNREYARKIFKDYNNIQHIYEPFVGWRAKPYKGPTTTISPQGLRVHTAPSISADTSKVVRFFGGSTMWGEGADNNNTIAARYNEANPELEVYNHAQLAYNTRQNLDALLTLYEEQKTADVVVFYDGVNDVAFLCPTDVDVPGHRLVPMFRDRLYVSNTRFAWDIFRKIFLENIVKVIRKHSNVDYSQLYNCLSDEEKGEKIADFIITNWEIAHQLVTSKGGKFIALLQPAAYIGTPKTDHLQLGPEMGKNFEHVYDIIKTRIREKNYDWVYDVTDSFDKDEYIYIDFCHVSANGNKIIADKIDSIIKRDSVIVLSP